MMDINQDMLDLYNHGQALEDDSGKRYHERDAIHAAYVICRWAGQDLLDLEVRGRTVELSFTDLPVPKGLIESGKNAYAAASGVPVVDSQPSYARAFGVLDPFYSQATLRTGDFVRVFIKPGTVDSLRHEYNCPALNLYMDSRLAENPKKDYAIQELTGLARELSMTLPELLGVLGDCLATGESHYLNFDSPDMRTDKIWDCYQQVTGKPVLDSDRFFPFRCSC